MVHRTNTTSLSAYVHGIIRSTGQLYKMIKKNLVIQQVFTYSDSKNTGSS